jgi:hypothetical protein
MDGRRNKDTLFPKFTGNKFLPQLCNFEQCENAFTNSQALTPHAMDGSASALFPWIA